MNTETPNSEYLLLIRGTHWDQGLSADEMQRVMGDFNAWIDKLVKAGVHRGAQPLLDEGRIVTGPNGASVTDGAFAESKEAVGGYFLIEVPTLGDAVRFAQACPILAHGAQIGVRPVAPMCRMQAYVNAMQDESALA